MCNRAPVATFTQQSHEPDGPYPGGTHGRIHNPEVISDADIRDPETKRREERRGGVRAGETEGAEPKEGASKPSTGSRPAGESIAEVEEADDKDAEEPRNNGQRRQVPGGEWLSQVRAYLNVKVLPEWMRVERKREKGIEEPGRDREEGI
ncbi:hypothetical protein NDU88_001175 [Pleurodeles waltl]|uniref:Uncharacterized protein n=1 Tax=Pleurodeles waltl TaxID=8319 RepID=A0AAV7RC29_PLEWA|nr:hypothetical protein NDU88_001175 [Pleurodeles waltl]